MRMVEEEQIYVYIYIELAWTCQVNGSTFPSAVSCQEYPNIVVAGPVPGRAKVGHLFQGTIMVDWVTDHSL